MQVINEITGKPINRATCARVVVGYVEGQLVYGYISTNTFLEQIQNVKKVEFRCYGTKSVYIPSFGEDNIAFSNRRGIYIFKPDYSKDDLILETQVKGYGDFPYQTIVRNYEAIESFDIFNNRQEVLNCKDYILADFFPYTFGLEYETSQGYIPEDICFRDGLIPLRDGSIQGIEYSSVVLEGNEGLSLMEQQFETLKNYTWFNKECSLHVHIGGFPLKTGNIYSLYRICKKVEGELLELLPDYTFSTRSYKENGKDYCKKLPMVRSFNQLYEYLVGRKFYGSFNQGHPRDVARQAKWRVDTRYYWCNFINLLCYNVNKTVEFRLLKPSYNFEKAVLWLYIFNALMQVAEKHITDGIVPSNFCIESALVLVYPPEIVDRLKCAMAGLKAVKINQSINGDSIGREVAIEDNIFTGNFGILYK